MSFAPTIPYYRVVPGFRQTDSWSGGIFFPFFSLGVRVGFAIRAEVVTSDTFRAVNDGIDWQQQLFRLASGKFVRITRAREKNTRLVRAHAFLDYTSATDVK